MYKSRRRPWVKLYCRDWLTSTVRFDLTESDRSRFIDLLAMAGDSKFPGIVAAGLDGDGKMVGYPMDWLASTMRCSIPELAVSLEKFVKSDRVKVSGTSAVPIIHISSWKRYQSEYLRQVAPFTGKKTQASSAQLSQQTSVSSLHPLAPEVEVEVEVERDAEGERTKRATPAPDERLNVESVKDQIAGRREEIHGRESAAQRRLRRSKEALDSVG